MKTVKVLFRLLCSHSGMRLLAYLLAGSLFIAMLWFVCICYEVDVLWRQSSINVVTTMGFGVETEETEAVKLFPLLSIVIPPKIVIVDGSGLSGISDEMVESIRAPYLTSLNLWGDGVTDRIAPCLSRFRAIEQLGLTSTQISDRTAKEITRLKHLRELSVRSTRVTSIGLEQIASSMQKGVLACWDTPDADEIGERLQQRYPDLEIDW